MRSATKCRMIAVLAGAGFGGLSVSSRAGDQTAVPSPAPESLASPPEPTANQRFQFIPTFPLSISENWNGHGGTDSFLTQMDAFRQWPSRNQRRALYDSSPIDVGAIILHQ